MGLVFPQLAQHYPAPNSYKTCTSVVIWNGDKCKVDNWVLVSTSSVEGQLKYVPCKVKEILKHVQYNGPDKFCKSFGILLQHAKVLDHISPYQMPQICLEDEYSIATLDVSQAFNF
jgi:hypothetical protein